MTNISADAISEGLDAILDRVETTLETCEDRFPFVADQDTGEWETTADGNWCAGHWIGLLWLAHEHRDEDRFAKAAHHYIGRMESGGVLNSMFGGMCYLYAGFRGYDVIGDRDLFELGLKGADAMVDQFNPFARQIPNGVYDIKGPKKQFEFSEAVYDRPRGDVIGVLDTIYTCLPILWRAYCETNDPQFRDVALSHANRHLDWYIKPDYRLWNLAEFDPHTGELRDRYNHLAYSDESCWARGMGWNIAGLAYAYDETGAERFRRALEGCINYYREKAPNDLVPYWDFEDPAIPDAPRDTSCAGIAAYGLINIDRAGEAADQFREFGIDILDSLLSEYLVYKDTDRRGMVLHGCYNKPGEYATDNEHIWTDYYVAYALHELR